MCWCANFTQIKVLHWPTHSFTSIKDPHYSTASFIHSKMYFFSEGFNTRTHTHTHQNFLFIYLVVIQNLLCLGKQMPSNTLLDSEGGVFKSLKCVFVSHSGFALLWAKHHWVLHQAVDRFPRLRFMAHWAAAHMKPSNWVASERKQFRCNSSQASTPRFNRHFC